MALPAMEALAKLAGQLTIQAPHWGKDVYRDISATVVSRGPMREADVAVLFPPSFRVAWQARGIPRRIGVSSDFRQFLLTDVVARGQHRGDTYAALASAAGAVVTGSPTFQIREEDPMPDVPDGHIGLNPISVSGAVVQWAGYRALALACSAPVVFYAGPGEEQLVREVAGPFSTVVGLPLPAFARALSRARVFVSNDSGAAHFARASGAKTVVIYGSTSPAVTGPQGAIHIEPPNLACRPCYKKRCPTAIECLDIPLQRVLEVIEGNRV
jgi:heptosyltransferase II